MSLPGPAAQTRIADIEVLRGVAILMVLIQHIPGLLLFWHTRLSDLQPYWHGAAGVDLFFAISGFVIARRLLPGLEACGSGQAFWSETRLFLVRRFWRLLPAAWLWIAIPLVLSATLNQTHAFQPFAVNLSAAVAAFCLAGNLWLGAVFGVHNVSILAPYWSLSLEEQFYCLLPLAAWLARGRLHYAMLLLVAYQFFLPADPLSNATRPGSIAAGVLLAMWSRHAAYGLAEPRFLARGPLVRGGFLVSCLALVGLLEGVAPFPLRSLPYGLVAVITAVLVYAASFGRGYIMRDGRLRRMFCWVGARSYAMYLAHLPVFAACHEVFFRIYASSHLTLKQQYLVVAARAPNLPYLALAAAMLLVVSDLTYRYVEGPGRRHGRRLTQGLPVP